MPHSAPIRPSIALAAFAEKFVDGRRVLVFGNALSPFWEQLIERGARLVHVCDSDATRVSEAAARNTSQNVSFAPLGGAGLAVRDGAFDVGFIEDLTAHADPAATLHRLNRALSPRGIAFVAAPNPDVEESLIPTSTDHVRPLDYYSLYDLVHREFPVVRMAGQMPFVGYSVAELAPPEDPEPSLDAGFVPGGSEEPEWFVAIASQLDVVIDSFVVVQLPHNQLTKSGAERLLREQLRAARSAERSAVERLSRLEAEQRKLADVAQRHQKDVDFARQMRLLQEELERKESWILQLEARAATADARADEADQELEELRSKLLVPEPQPSRTDETQKSIEQLETDKRDGQKTIEQLETDKRDGQKTIERLETEKHDWQKTFERLETEKHDWQKTIERLETEKCELVGKLTMAQTERDAEQRAAAEKAGLSNQLKLAEEQQRELTQRLETQKAEAVAALALAEVQRAQTERELSETRQRLAELTTKLELEDPEQLSELRQLETQLRERGERIRKLELDLKQTEELGARLVRELARAQTSSSPLAPPIAAPNATPVAVHPAVEPATAGADLAVAPLMGELQQPGTATVSSIATESWTQGPTPTASASTQLSADQSSAWVEPKPAGDSELATLREKLDALSVLAAKQQADLSAHEWRLQQLLRDNQDLIQRSENFDEICLALEQAQQRLQQNEVLLTQLGASSER